MLQPVVEKVQRGQRLTREDALALFATDDLVGLTLAAGLVWYGASQTSDVVAQERLIVLGPWAAGLLLVVVLPGLALASAAWHGRTRTRYG